MLEKSRKKRSKRNGKILNFQRYQNLKMKFKEEWGTMTPKRLIRKSSKLKRECKEEWLVIVKDENQKILDTSLSAWTSWYTNTINFWAREAKKEVKLSKANEYWKERAMENF